jgi:RNA polymerase sigma factor (sigma-70 family)
MELPRSSAAPSYFQASIPLIDDVISFHACRGRLNSDEREDFRSWAIEKLIENDYGRLRRFEGRSSLRSFVSVVVAHLLVDYWQSKGPWRRPSSTAKLFAPEGIWLERYLGYGYTVSESVHLVISNHGSRLTEDELFHITLRLPLQRTRPREVPESLAAEVGTVNTSPERLVDARAEDASRARLEDALERALGALSSDERVFVRMRFEDGSRINEIARAFHLPEKVFYRRFQGTLRRLRRNLRLGIDVGFLALYREPEPRAVNIRARAV